MSDDQTTTLVSARVDADLFSRANLARSTNPVRQYLNGVRIEPSVLGGVYLIGTDGHRLHCFYDAEGTANTAATIALRPHLLKECKPRRKAVDNSYRRDLVIEGDCASVVTDAGAEILDKGCIVEGSFPDWRRVVPRDNNAPVTASFDIRLVADAAKALTTGSKPVLRIYAAPTHGEASPHIAFGEMKNGFAVLMPIRGSGDHAMPEWLA
jgi:hypothetical protein